MKYIHKLRIWSVFVMILIGGVASFFGLSHHQDTATVAEKQQSRKTLPLRQSKDPQYPVYPYSVISGGVRTPFELKQAVDSDPIVKQHYIGFKVSQAHLIKNARAKKVFVSFRKGNQVFWTKKRVCLPAGELVMADGKHAIRARCGNRISEKAQANTTAEEPSEEELNEPELANNILAFAGQPVTVKAGENQETEIVSSNTASSESKGSTLVASRKESSNPSSNSPIGTGFPSGGMPGNLPGGNNAPTGKSGSTDTIAPPSASTFLSPPAFPVATLPLLNTFVPALPSSSLLPVFSPRIEQIPTIPLLPLYTEKIAVGQNLAVAPPENLVIQSLVEDLKPTVLVSQALPTSQPEVTTPEVSTIGLVAGVLGIGVILTIKRQGWLRLH